MSLHRPRRPHHNLSVTDRVDAHTLRPFIRVLTSQDLATIGAELPAAPYRTHQDDLDWQATGAVTSLVAWLDSTPVGWGFISWNGPRDATVATLLPVCPEIFRLYVVEKHRSAGFGTALVLEFESLAHAKGLAQVGLGVGIANQRARGLYERLGYQTVAGSEYVDRWDYPDARGRRRTAEEPCIFMVRALGSHMPAPPEYLGDTS